MSFLERTYSYVKRGKVKSCKECQKINFSKKLTGKGLGNKRLQAILNGMKTRCYDKNQSEKYKYHYGRGIKICDQWRTDTKSFIDRALSNGYDESLSIDRKDNDGDYTPSNCRWVDRREQTLNSRLRSDNTTSERCVSMLRGKYQLTIDGKYIGIYNTVLEATVKRDSIIKKDRITSK